MKEDPTLGRIGGFRLIRLISSGDSTEVLLARTAAPSGLERTVLLKRLLPQHAAEADLARTFSREASAYARLNHPCIVRLLDFFTSAGQPIMVFEYIDGATLAQLMLRTIGVGKGFDDGAAIFIGLRLFEALSAAHAARDPETGDFASIVHRDASPANVLLPWDGNAKLTDFGIAKVMRADGETKTGAAVARGAFGYMAPEQITGERVTARSDVYTASIVLWELLARRRAIQTDSLGDYDALRAMAEPSIASLESLRPELAPALLDAVSRGLTPQAKGRSISAEEMVGVLRELLPSLESAREAVVALLKPLRGATLGGAATVRTVGIAASALSALDEPMRLMTPTPMRSPTAPPASVRPAPPRPAARPSIPPPSIPLPPQIGETEATLTDLARAFDRPSVPSSRRSLPPPLPPAAPAPVAQAQTLVDLVDDDDLAPPIAPSAPPALNITLPLSATLPIDAGIRLDLVSSSAPPAPVIDASIAAALASGPMPPPGRLPAPAASFAAETPGSPVLAVAPRRGSRLALAVVALVAVASVGGLALVVAAKARSSAHGGAYERAEIPVRGTSGAGGDLQVAALDAARAAALDADSSIDAQDPEVNDASAAADVAAEASPAPIDASREVTDAAAHGAVHAPASEAPAPAATAPAVAPASQLATGVLRLPPRSTGRRVWVDGKLVGQGPEPRTLACGKHSVKVGSGGVEVSLDVPCGGEVDVP
jgi:serine/threonine-protein kinase